MIIQQYNNPLMLYIVDNQKFFLDELEKKIISNIIDYKLNPNKKTNDKMYLTFHINKNLISKSIEKEFVKILLNRIRYKEPFISNEELNKWFEENFEDILENIYKNINFTYF